MPPNTHPARPASTGSLSAPLEHGGLQRQRPDSGPGADRVAGGRGVGPLRNGNPRGDPNLAPRCGAKRRMTSCACRAPAMPNGRCRLHGGKSTGPRTPEGKARTVAAHTTHGWFAESGAPKRALQRYTRSLIVRIDLTDRATLLQEYLPPGMARRLDEAPPELHAPKHPSQVAFEAQVALAAANERRGRRGRERTVGTRPAVAEIAGPAEQGMVAQGTVAQGTVAQETVGLGRVALGRVTLRPVVPAMSDWRGAERAAAQAEVAALAPWRAAIAFARTAKRAARAAAREARARLAVGDRRGQRTHPMNREAAVQEGGRRFGSGGAAGGAAMPSSPELASVLAGTNLLYRELAMRAAGLRPGFGGQPCVVGTEAAQPAVGRPAVGRPAVGRLGAQQLPVARPGAVGAEPDSALRQTDPVKREAGEREAVAGPRLARPTPVKMPVPGCTSLTRTWGLAKTSEPAKTWELADLRAQLDARFGCKAPVGWHPPQASPAGFAGGLGRVARTDPVKREDR